MGCYYEVHRYIIIIIIIMMYLFSHSQRECVRRKLYRGALPLNVITARSNNHAPAAGDHSGLVHYRRQLDYASAVLVVLPAYLQRLQSAALPVTEFPLFRRLFTAFAQKPQRKYAMTAVVRSSRTVQPMYATYCM